MTQQNSAEYEELSGKEIISDTYLLVEILKDSPHTYDTILKDDNNNTNQTILRRKLSSLCKDGTIAKTTVPMTRFGQSLFYAIDKNYYMLFEKNSLQCNVYYFYESEEVGNFFLLLEHCWKLDFSSKNWIKNTGIKINIGNILKCI